MVSLGSPRTSAEARVIRVKQLQLRLRLQSSAPSAHLRASGTQAAVAVTL